MTGFTGSGKGVYLRSAMPVLTITSRKGGRGKTMLVEVLVGTLAERGIDAAILDADLNATAHRWATSVREGDCRACRR